MLSYAQGWSHSEPGGVGVRSVLPRAVPAPMSHIPQTCHAPQWLTMLRLKSFHLSSTSQQPGEVGIILVPQKNSWIHRAKGCHSMPLGLIVCLGFSGTEPSRVLGENCTTALPPCPLALVLTQTQGLSISVQSWQVPYHKYNTSFLKNIWETQKRKITRSQSLLEFCSHFPCII